jgi:hypothetical protein
MVDVECSSDQVIQSGDWVVRTNLARIALLRQPILPVDVLDEAVPHCTLAVK